MLEVYPHTALLELFRLPSIVRYKKGNVAERRSGQRVLQRRLWELSRFAPPLECTPKLSEFLSTDTNSLRGAALKSNEDALDAIVCAYTAYYYWFGVRPEQPCLVMLISAISSFRSAPSKRRRNLSSIANHAPFSGEHDLGAASREKNCWTLSISAPAATCNRNPRKPTAHFHSHRGTCAGHAHPAPGSGQNTSPNKDALPAAVQDNNKLPPNAPSDPHTAAPPACCANTRPPPLIPAPEFHRQSRATDRPRVQASRELAPDNA